MKAAGCKAAGGWPLAAVLALTVLGQGLHAGRRRIAINRALHEVRRPLQAMALAGPGLAPGGGSLGLAVAALAQLDAEVNRGPLPAQPAPVPCRDLLDAAVTRWRDRAEAAGKSIELRKSTLPTEPVAGPAAVAQAVDNLIVNAIEHGGSAIVVEAVVRGRRLRIDVADDGDGLSSSRHGAPRLASRRRRGHGLDVVHRVASAQGGRFFLRRAETGTVAHLELPVLGDRCAA